MIPFEVTQEELMSRTIRRKNVKNPWPKTEWTDWRGKIRHWGHDDWEWHSDKYRWNYHGYLKEFTTYIRRNDEREMLHRVMKDEEYDCYDLEKAYLGHIWNFD
jgi:hypothetical protein